MAMGRGSCIIVLFSIFLVIGWSSYSQASTTHIVGDSLGWNLDVSYPDWVEDKTFRAGDTLQFNYKPGTHNTVPISTANSYNSCKASASDLKKAQSSGNDKFTLKKGDNFFLCSLPGHCSAGMKIKVTAQ